MGGRDQEMTFGIGRINYGTLYGTGTSEQTIAAATATVDGPNKGAKFNLAHLPSDAVVIKDMGKAAVTGQDNNSDLAANKTYIVTTVSSGGEEAYGGAVGKTAKDILATANLDAYVYNQSDNATKITGGNMAEGDVFVVGATKVAKADLDGNIIVKEVNDSTTKFLAGHEYEIVSFGAGQNTDASKTVVATTFKDVDAIGRASADVSTNDILTVGKKFTVDADASVAELAHLNALTQGMTFRMTTDTLTKDIEAIQGLINTARVQAGSQYAALESAVNYTTDLTAQYELGYNTVNDVNFSMETAHLAKNQILQQAATAMLAQANQGQQGLLQLIS
jgi:flagellin-like hook-associated protein FlgL